MIFDDRIVEIFVNFLDLIQPNYYFLDKWAKQSGVVASEHRPPIARNILSFEDRIILCLRNIVVRDHPVGNCHNAVVRLRNRGNGYSHINPQFLRRRSFIMQPHHSR